MFRIPKYKLLVLILLIFSCFLIFNYIDLLKNKQTKSLQNRSNTNKSQDARYQDKRKEQNIASKIVISFVVCNSRMNESLNVVKSVLLFTSTPVHFVIFTDNNLMSKFNYTLTNWKKIRTNLDFELHKIKFPELHEEDWLNLFSKCAAQRLFLPKLLSHIDSVIYVDTDTLFLGPVDELWEYFYKFNTTQISGLALEDDNPNISWYPRFAKHPFYGKYGLNSGVMLMNLTRLRSFGWVDYVTPIMLKWKLYIPWGDQDIINIVFHYHEPSVYVLSCRYNYRTDQCVYGDACHDATKHGIYLLHGSRGAFHTQKQPAFKAIYRAIDEYELDMDPRMTVLEKMERYLDEGPASNCGALKQAFLKLPNETIQHVYNKPDR